MKTFSVAVAVAVVLAFVWIQESSAFPFTEVQMMEEPMDNVNNDSPVAEHEEMPVEAVKMLFNRQKRESLACRYCCDCCEVGVCGYCCPKGRF